MIEASFHLYDTSNPALGYVVEINDGTEGLLSSATDPADGSDLKTAADCLRVIRRYIRPLTKSLHTRQR
jgi:hypothetical protein